MSCVLPLPKRRSTSAWDASTYDVSVFGAGAALSVLLTVEDLDRSLNFYVGLLGAQVVDQSPWHAEVQWAPGTRLHLATPGPETPDRSGVALVVPQRPDQVDTLLVFAVPDAQVVYDALTAAGLRALGVPSVPPWGGELRFFFRDPDGHVVEVFSRIAAVGASEPEHQ